MDILLVKPWWQRPMGRDLIYNRIWPPLCLANCAALLEKDSHRVKILDAHAERILPYKIEDYIDGFDKIFITSSSLDRWQCPNLDIRPFIDTVQAIRRKTKEIYVMGYHGTIRPIDILQLTEAKAVIRNEPEITIAQICRDKDLSKIDGITYRKNGQFIFNKDRDLINLEDLPIPAFHLLNFKRYYYEILGDNFALFEGSRGCPHNCVFCSKIMYGNRFRQKSPQKLTNEIDDAITNYGVKTGYFIDLDFTINKGWTEEVCERIISRRYDFDWCCQTRPDSVDTSLLKKMKRARCQLIHFGVETASLRIMRAINKELPLKKIEEVVRISEEIGIKALCFFRFGFLSESRKEINQSIAFSRKLNPSYVSYNIVFPYEESKDWESANNFLQCWLSNVVRLAIIGFYLRPSYIFKIIKQKDIKMIFKQVRLLWGFLK